MYSFYVDGVLLPVTPESDDFKIDNNNKTYTMIDGGSYNHINPPGLSTWELTAEIPIRHYPYAKYENGFLEPTFFLTLFERLKTSLKPTHLVIIRPGNWDNDVTCTLEDYSVQESVKQAGDLVVKLKFKQYLDKRTKNYKVDTKEDLIEEGKPNPDELPGGVKTYKVQYNDHLKDIMPKLFPGDKNFESLNDKINAGIGLGNSNRITGAYSGEAVPIGSDVYLQLMAKNILPLVVFMTLNIDYDLIVDYVKRNRSDKPYRVDAW